MDKIRICGARTHNLQNIDVELPRNQLVVITGLSGSGKSSLAFDTLYAESQRRYVESLSAYARQFLSLMEKPDADHIEGLSPAISIEQKSTSHNPRSTVGTLTEIYDYLRLLFARVGEPCCPNHGNVLKAQSIDQMVDTVFAQIDEGTWKLLLAPVVHERKGEHLELISKLQAQGFVRARIDKKLVDLDTPFDLDRHQPHSIEVVVDRLRIRSSAALRLAESLETALAIANGQAVITSMNEDDMSAEIFLSANFACPHCEYSFPELAPRLFSFNNPAGACSECDGLGVKTYFDPKKVVSHPEFSLPGGAIRGWDRRYPYYFQMINALGKHYQFDLDTPFQDLTEKIQNTLLYGSDEEVLTFVYQNDRGRVRKRKHPFEGIIPNMERRYRETESNTVREELARFLGQGVCPICTGQRLNLSARHVFLAEQTLPSITSRSIRETHVFLSTLSLPGSRGDIAARILREINDRLQFLIDVGLHYLTLDRSADTLSGGEAQRIRLASQIGAGLVGVMYVLDEPSIGLHQRDNRRLLDSLAALRDLGNTVIVVEHDEEAILTADHVLDMGPGAGVQGGQVISQGSPQAVCADPHSLTGQYLSQRRVIPTPPIRVAHQNRERLYLRGACGNNLKSLDVELPLGLMICVTGVSGSGKSTLINDTLYRAAVKKINGAGDEPAPYNSLDGLALLNKVVAVDQSPIGRTPRSNPATYTGLFTIIRELFAGTPEARSRGYTPGRFSFNVRGGRCEACSGDGLIKVEMYFLSDIYVSCDVCQGRRYNRETLDILYRGHTIDDVLNMTVADAAVLFSAIPTLSRKLQTLIDVGLSYVRLGQSAITLSGGEAQRVKLSRELSKRDTGDTLYILDEPTTGLHFYDVEQLLHVLHQLRDRGNTVVVIEHNLEVIKTADWVIDLGPEGGDGGGNIVAIGTPEDIVRCSASHTGVFLAPILRRTVTEPG